MAEETTVLTGVLEDSQGRKIMPDTTAAQVMHSDGESTETKLARFAASSTQTTTIAASATRTVVDLSSYISNRAGTSYRVEVLTSTADGEDPVASVLTNLIGDYAVFSRQGVTVTKEITITYRLVSMPIY